MSSKPPRPTAGPVVIAFAIAGVVLGGVVLWGLSRFSTAITSSPARFLIGLVLFIVLARFGVGYFRQFDKAPPEEPIVDVPAETGLVYVCEMCGTELALQRLAKEKPPKHCGEEMTLIRR